MASASEIAEVRSNTNEPLDVEPYTDSAIGLLIDENGVMRASAVIWRRKAAAYADMVNVSEAGSSHALGELQDKALKMAQEFESSEASGGMTNRPRVKKIERT